MFVFVHIPPIFSVFYWHIRLKSTAYFFEPPCIYTIVTRLHAPISKMKRFDKAGLHQWLRLAVSRAGIRSKNPNIRSRKYSISWPFCSNWKRCWSVSKIVKVFLGYIENVEIEHSRIFAPITAAWVCYKLTKYASTAWKQGIHGVKWRHRIYGHNTIAVLWV